MKRIRKRKGFCNLTYCILFYILVSIILYIFVKECGLWAALAVTAVSYPTMVLIIATILRMRGDITERSFIILIFEGFKITHLIQNIRNDSVNIKSNNPPRSKKSS
jgi:hypothetical protein